MNNNSIDLSFEFHEIDLQSTLDGGQAFRWYKDADNFYRGVIYNRSISLHSKRKIIQVKINDNKPHKKIKNILNEYLDSPKAYEEFYNKYSKDLCLGPAVRSFKGLRILRQDPWECLFSFITSTTNNLLRIKFHINNISYSLGEKIGPTKYDYTFPRPENVLDAGESFLRELGFGFRAKYLIYAANEIVNNNFNLNELKKNTYIDAKKHLTTLYGVGEKVADCVLAFSLDKNEAFPVDRHIHRALIKWYGVSKKMSLADISKWAIDYFGTYGSIANQYMFHRERLLSRAKNWGGNHINFVAKEDYSSFS
ncbi:MAG: hypothetical protein CL774_00285 [Chloroflexi bacterium]|nr:hypothetical protein [Chloroflexota bacterium]|tara:strand:+ start:2712 stop:3638 length:927 start_codon:yes stop_codon:yes gene_type:complete